MISQLRDLDIDGASRALNHGQETHAVRAGHGGLSLLVGPSLGIALRCSELLIVLLDVRAPSH